MRVQLDLKSQGAVDYVARTVFHGAPERVALSRAERKFGIPRDYLRALVRLAKESEA